MPCLGLKPRLVKGVRSTNIRLLTESFARGRRCETTFELDGQGIASTGVILKSIADAAHKASNALVAFNDAYNTRLLQLMPSRDDIGAKASGIAGDGADFSGRSLHHRDEVHQRSRRLQGHGHHRDDGIRY